MVEDALGREWQLATVQLDFTQPENFEMTYIAEDGTQQRPAVLHVAILGSFERFMGIIIEHYGGAFPAWLAPVQAKILAVSEQFDDYATKVYDELKAAGARVEIDYSNDNLGKKIRNAELQKVPYMIVVGEKEREAGNLAVRSYETKEQTAMGMEEFLKLLGS
jgi:threonyl-tRNA synthetase